MRDFHWISGFPTARLDCSRVKNGGIMGISRINGDVMGVYDEDVIGMGCNRDILGIQCGCNGDVKVYIYIYQYRPQNMF